MAAADHHYSPDEKKLEDPVPEYSANGQYPDGFDPDEADAVCPPHTTERKLMAKIDARVIPFLCILYLLAFLDR